MVRHDDHGMATAEYTIGTLGAVMIASVLIRFGLFDDGNPWMRAVKDLLDQALGWGKLIDRIPGLGIRGG